MFTRAAQFPLGSALSAKRLARSLVTILVLTLIQVTLPITSNLFMPTAQAANLYENRANFQQWTTWHGVAANHVPYKTSAGTAEITANSDTINLTQDAGSQTGFLWNSQTYSYDQDLTVSANYFLGAKDGADGIMFAMRPLNQWPNLGTAGASTGNWQHWGTGEIRAVFDTYQNGTERADDHLRVQAVTTAGAETTFTGTGVLLKNASGTNITEVENNQSYPFTIRWTAATRTFAVFSGLSANHEIYSTQISSAQMNATQFAWGWMGWTGGASNFHAISDVTYHVGPTASSSDTDMTVTHGASVTLNATSTTSESSPTRRWEFSTDGGSTWTSTGISTATYTFTADRSFTQRRYRFYIESTAVGITYSKSTNPIILTVLPPVLGADTDTALTFSAGKYAWAPDSNEFDIANAITIQAWVYQTESLGSSWNMVVNKESSYELGTIAGTWYFGLRSTGWAGKDTEVPTKYNAWQHVALTRASGSSTANFYVDGQLRWSGTADGAGVAGLANTTQPFTIGGRSGDGVTFSSPFAGQIDELRVFNSARTASEIQSDMMTYGPINTPSLAVYYDFNEGTSSKLYNRVRGASSDSDLTIVNSPAWDGSMIESTTVSGAYTVKRFLRSYLTSNNGWRVPNGVTRVRALVIAGGGGGGNDEGGGGGGGGFIDTATLIFSPNAIARVTVGAGGVGADGNDVFYASNGQNSLLDTLIAVGGGAGGSSVNTNIGVRNGSAGGSGGGGAGESLSNRAGGAGTATQGFAGGIGINGGSGGGGGGASEVGNTDGNGLGGDGRTSDISGSNVIYGGGGGGGNGNTGSTSYAGGDGGGGRGGSSNVTARNGTAWLGGGGGGGGSLASASSSVAFSGADGGSGVIIIRWITASKPIFTQPTNDTTTAGLTDTITVSANPIGTLIRNYQWQSSTDTGTTWSNIASNSGSGALTNTYTTPILDTSTSGSRYQYRVVVTDSDTSGLFIVDTSTAVFIVINPPITFSGTYTSQKYGEGDSDTFTVLNGTGNKSFTYNPGTRSGITWSSPSANTAVVTVARTVPVGSYPETITATDTRGAQAQLVVSVDVTKADTITVTALARSETYTGSALTFTPSFAVVGLKNSDTVTPISWEYTGADNAGTTYLTSTTRPMNAGSYTIDPIIPTSLLDSYTAVTRVTSTLTINRATRTIAMTAPASPLKYGDTRTAVATPSAGSGDGTISYLTSTSDSCTVSSSTIRAVRSAGTCSFTATITRGNNFETATTTQPVTTTLTKADTITVQMRNPVTLTFTGNQAASVPTLNIVGLVHTDTATATRLYTHSASAVGAPESYAALTDSSIVPTDVETYTVSSSALTFSSGVESNYVNVVRETSTLIINQANQQPLRIAMYGAFVGSSYTITTDGGSGGGLVTETTTAGSTASNCLINNRVLTMSSTVQSFCNILVTKGASRNFRAETATAQITFYLFVPTVSIPTQGSGPNVALTGENVVTVDLANAPTITGLSTLTLSLSASGNFTISGNGFGLSQLTVKFWRNKSLLVTSGDGSTLVIPISSIAALSPTTGKVVVVNGNGTAVSIDTLTITP